MVDDIPNEPDATVTVDVVADPPADETPDDNSTVVIVESGTDAGTETVTEIELDRWVRLEERLGNIESRLSSTEGAAYTATATADEALETANDAGEHADVAADEAVEVAVDAVEDGEVVKNDEGDTVVEADTTPGRASHWLYRPFSEWRHGR